MNDTNTNLQVIKDAAKAFVAERDWAQFHHPKDLAMNLSCEAAELMELFLWASKSDIAQRYKEDAAYKERIAEEMGDIIFAIAKLANCLDCDLATVFFEKLKKTATKYKIEECKGTYTKK
ncbi:nucleotide pyrophosphohydrolase [Candidatus Dependentiae bacterium]|nr:nucleotide pyrophosphohydrolase [Candidatus Dependentiae bacterium]